ETGDFRTDSGKLTVNGLALEPVVPLKAIEAQVIAQARHDLGKQLQNSDVEVFQKKFQDAKGDEEEVKKVIAEHVKKMGLENARGASQFDGDRYTLANDPGLKPLLQALLRTERLSQNAAREVQAEA